MKTIILLATFLFSSLSLCAEELPALKLQLVADGFTSPLVFEPFNDGSGHTVIVDQIGVAKVLKKDGSVSDVSFLDVRDRMAKIRSGKFDERGLLGLAFHPKFKNNRKVYAYYSSPLRKDGPEGWDHTSRISEFKVLKNNRLQVDHTSERIVLEEDQPSFNHNGGKIAFGPDGFLYIGMGDGGNKNDEGLGHAPEGNGQSLKTIKGKILRIDVNTKKGYKIPKDNPFANDKKGRAEIYAYGIRNPWGISFDQGGDRRLFSADVGQNMFEEINIIKNGENYGWPVREGLVGFDAKNPIKIPENTPTKDANGKSFTNPAISYMNLKGHSSNRHAKKIRGISVTGGYVYRGSIEGLKGHYIFADWSRNWGIADGVVLNAAPDGKQWNLSVLPLEDLPKGNRLGAYTVGMGQDPQGEIYVLTNDYNSLKGESGKVYKLVVK
ncbi:PQQ-dependent sugar dehydrogenase [Verrucomicrobia bacterium]|nr:PQQ-dependent sugar dehydrogenase [Verrucomicrobiota bacterium]